jgi:hydroxymethylglutaryl-CoA reductase
MANHKAISGFSKLRKRDKIKWIAKTFFTDPEQVMTELASYWHKDEAQQKILDGFSENTLSNFPMPYGVAPNFMIDGNTYVVPMVIEESSVVAAASAAAKFWMSRGGFKTEIMDTQKVGQVHFKWTGNPEKLKGIFPQVKEMLIAESKDLTKNMEERGGGIIDIELLDFNLEEKGLYQIRAYFETCDSMGANFVNSCLERFGSSLRNYVIQSDKLDEDEKDVLIVMSILSNYTPDCIVRAKVECPVKDLGTFKGGLDAETFAEKFATAVKIAHIDPYRATTHNKGIYNGVDAVALATGNDFRAIESCGHTYASRDGKYRSLSFAEVENGHFKFWIDLPLAIGTVGGLTSLHPMAKRSLELLGNPDARTLMSIIASTGLAQNFAALRSLVTTGIQSGHMKMHLQNILNQMKATDEESEKALAYFDDRVISFAGVRAYLSELRAK